MAFRKRVYGGSRYGPRKRARFTKRRRTFKSRRRNAAYSSQRGNTVFTGFRGRKMSYRKYKRVLWNASTLAEHHRSVLMNSVSQTAPASNVLMHVVSYPMIPNNFWATVGGSVDGDLSFDGDIFIRGGIATLRVRNNGDAPVNVVVWKITTTDDGGDGYGVGGDESAMWDPTVEPRFEKDYRVKQRFAFSVEPNDSNNLMHYIRSQKIEGSNFNRNPSIGRSTRRDFWIVGINSAGSTSPNCTVNFGHNISFTTDRI